MTRKKKVEQDCTVYGAWNTLKDGKWHHVMVLRGRCGEQGDKRARELRETKYGAWTLEVKRTHDGTFYRLLPDDLNTKKVEAACLDIRTPFAYEDAVDRPRTVILKVTDIVFLLGLINNSAQLKEPQVKKLWDHRRPILATRLREALPEDIQDPFDLFEE